MPARHARTTVRPEGNPMRTIPVRPRSALTAALVLLGLVVLAGVLRADAPSSAAAPAGVHYAASAAGCGPLRGVYITTGGDPKLLPWCGERAGANSRVYFNVDRVTPLWLRGKDLTGEAEVGTVPAAPASPTPTGSASPSPTSTATTTSTTAGNVGELAPALSLDGVPAVTGSAGRVDVAWTPAKAPGGGAVAFYVVQGRGQSEAAWTQRGGSTTATHATITGLTPGADYVLRVQAVYSDGDRGPWSNALAVSAALG